jgi:hypothetical protein
MKSEYSCVTFINNNSFGMIPKEIERYLLRALRLKVSYHFRSRIQQEANLSKAIYGTTRAHNDTEEQVSYNLLNEEINALVESLPPKCKETYKLSREKG